MKTPAAERRPISAIAKAGVTLVLCALVAAPGTAQKDEYMCVPELGGLAGLPTPPKDDWGTGSLSTLDECDDVKLARNKVGKRWSVSLHAGFNDPQSDLAHEVDDYFSSAIDLEYAFNQTFALEAFVGFDQFSGKAPPDIDVTHMSVNGKAYFLPGLNRFYLNAGTGGYDFSPGSPETGFNLGLGGQFNRWPAAALEVGAKRHFVSSGGADLAFLTFQVGLRRRF